MLQKRFQRFRTHWSRSGKMGELKQFFRTLFNVEALEEVVDPCDAAGRAVYRMVEPSARRSKVVLKDRVCGVYNFDEFFEQKKLFNPSRELGYRARHDFIVLDESSSGIDLFLVEMKSNKDGFEHIRRQLQGGIALFAFIRRLYADRHSESDSFKGVRMFAVVLLHTEPIYDGTNMKKLKEQQERRDRERAAYAGKAGILCVSDGQTDLSELRASSAKISLDWTRTNSFPDFPIEVAE